MLNNDLQRIEYSKQQSGFHVSPMYEPATGVEHGWEVIATDVTPGEYYAFVRWQEATLDLWRTQHHSASMITALVIEFLGKEDIQHGSAQFTFLNDTYQHFLKRKNQNNG